MLKYNKCDTINNYQSFIFSAKEEIVGKNFKDIEKSILILLNKIANKNIQRYYIKYNECFSEKPA